MEGTCLFGYQQASASRFVTHTTVRVLGCKLGRVNSGRKSVVHVILAIRSLPLDARSQAS